MCECNTGPQWFAANVKSRHERAVAEQFSLKGVDGFLPLVRAPRQWSDRQKVLDVPLFPGYVFCRVTFGDRHRILRTPGFYSLVSFGNHPQSIPDAQIEAVRRMVSCGLLISPWPFLLEGQRVVVSSGSLLGLHGIMVRERNVDRVVISVELLKRSIAVEVDRDTLRAIV